MSRRLFIAAFVFAMRSKAVNLILFASAIIPGHALHEKRLQRQIGVGTLISSQERRAAVVRG